jgi:SET domain-containing protein
MPLASGLSVRPSPISGRGCFATQFFARGRKIAEYAGERISRREVARRLRTRRHRVLRICALDAYWSLDGARGGSCQPNAYMRTTRGHILFMALCDIHPGEEITVDYVTTLHPDTKRCRCRAPNCRGTINKV